MAYTKTWTVTEPLFRQGHDSFNASPTLTNFNQVLTQTRSGEKMPDWKEKVRSGINAATPFTTDRVSFRDCVPCSMSATMKETRTPWRRRVQYASGWLISPNPTGTLTHLLASEADANSIALSKVYKKVREEQQHMNSPAVLAEIFDVLRQFGSPFAAVIDLTERHLHKLDIAKRKNLRGSVSFRQLKWLEILASTYLDYSFGLVPLISDTKSAAETLARWELEPELPRLRAKVVGRGGSTVAKTLIGNNQSASPTWLRCESTSRQETETSVQYVVGLSQTIQAAFGSNQRLLQLLGFDHGNWIPAIYEAIPWSWLLDYFTNLQEILSAGFTNTADVKWIVKTVRTVSTKQFASRFRMDQLLASAASNNWRLEHFQTKARDKSWDDQGGRCTVVRTTLSRTIPTSLGIPSLVLEHPFENVGKLANMAAVLFSKPSRARALWVM